jgi:hypothetical protein
MPGAPEGGRSAGMNLGTAGRRFRGRPWAAVKRRLSNHYAQLTEADLAYQPGQEAALLQRVVARTKESPENLNRFLQEECGCVEMAPATRRSENVAG